MYIVGVGDRDHKQFGDVCSGLAYCGRQSQRVPPLDLQTDSAQLSPQRHAHCYGDQAKTKAKNCSCMYGKYTLSSTDKDYDQL